MTQTTVLIVDDHVVVRKGIQMIVATEPDLRVVGEARDGQEAIELAQELQPDVILMDLEMPRKNGIDAIARIKSSCPPIKMLVLTITEDDEKVEAALEAGADGYLLKDAEGESLLRAIKAVKEDEMPLHPRVARVLFKEGKNGEPSAEQVNGLLTDREKDVLQLVARGLSNKGVADALSLSIGTIKVHMSSILNKLNVNNRTEAAVLAAQAGMISVVTREQAAPSSSVQPS